MHDSYLIQAEAAFERWRRRAGLALGPLLLISLLLVPMPGLTPQAHTLTAIMALVLVFWVSEAIPLAATALLGPALCIVLGVAKDKEVLSQFGHPIIFLFIGSFLLAQAMQKHGLDRRLALGLLAVPGVAKSPTTLFAAFAVLTAGLSMWMSNSATAAVMLPIALGVVSVSPAFADLPGAKSGLVLMVAFAASVGGLATPVGTPPNLIGIGYLEELTGQRITFVRWMQLGLPLMLVLLAFLLWLLRPRRARAFADHAALTAEFRRQFAALGPLRAGAIHTTIAFALALLLWIYPGLVEAITGKPALGAAWLKQRLPEETVGLCAGLLLFLLPVRWREGEFTLEWRDAMKIDWGTILLFGGGLALGKQIFDTGLGHAAGGLVQTCFGQPGLWTLTAAGILLSILLSESTSNTASATVMVPAMIAVAQATQVNPLPVALASCLACSLGFMLPVSTPPNALAYGTGLVRLTRMIRCGIWLDLAGAVAIWLLVRLLAPVLGWR